MAAPCLRSLWPKLFGSQPELRRWRACFLGVFWLLGTGGVLGGGFGWPGKAFQIGFAVVTPPAGVFLPGVGTLPSADQVPSLPEAAEESLFPSEAVAQAPSSPGAAPPPDGPKAVEQAPSPPEAAEQAPSPSEKPPKPQKLPSQAKELFDGRSLAGWKVLEELAFKGHGKVEVRDGQIRLGQGEPFTGIRWTGPFPRSHYEVLIEACRVEGDDFFCGLVFPVGQADCSLIVGGWGGSTVGLSNIDGEPAAENETARIYDFEKGHWYSIRLRVTDRKIQVWIDREKLVDFEYPDRKLSIRWDQEPMRPFGICTWRTTGAVRKVELRRLAPEEPARQKEPSAQKEVPGKAFSPGKDTSSGKEESPGKPASPRQALCSGQAPSFGGVPSPGKGKSPGKEESPAQEAASGTSALFSVPNTFDGHTCSCQIEFQKSEGGFRVYRLRYPSPIQTPVVENNTIPAEYYLPDRAETGPARPAVIVLHILNGNYELERLLCRTLALRGIPALMFKLPYYDERAPAGGRKRLLKEPELFVQALPQALADCRRTIDVLAARPEVDPNKISLAGISLGGIVGASTAGADSRVHRAALILAGGDLLRIISHCREARPLRQFLESLPPAERQKMEKALAEIDPLRYAPDLRQRAQAGRVLMVNADQDEVIPRPCTEKLAAALGMADRVIWLHGLGHYTAIAALPETLERTVAFFAQDLPAEAKPPAVLPGVGKRPGEESPPQVLAALLQQGITILLKDPAEGRCHLLDLSAEVVDPAGKKYEGRLRWIRGAEYRFRLEVKIAGLPEAELGQGDRPWLAAKERVFVGRSQTGQEPPTGPQRRNPLQFVPDRHLVRLKAWTAALQGLAQMPSLVESLVEAELVPTPSEEKPPLLPERKPHSTPEGKPQTPLETEKASAPPAAPAEKPGSALPGLGSAPSGRILRLRQKDKIQNTLQIHLTPEGRPSRLELSVNKFQAKITVHGWQVDGPAPAPLFDPPDRPVQQVDPEDLIRIWSAIVEFLMEKTE